MKKVLFVNHVSGIGGGSYAFLRLIRELDRAQIEPTVLLRSDGPLVKELEALGVKVYFLSKLAQVQYNLSFDFAHKWRMHLSILLSVFQFCSFLIGHRFDTIYLNSMMLYQYLLPAKLLGIKTIIHCRENWPSGEHKIQRKIAIDRIERRADHILAINHSSASMFSHVFSKVKVVYDWIDFSDRYEPCSFDQIFNEDCSRLKVFVFLGGFNPIKGCLEVLDVFCNRLKSVDYRLLVLGDLNGMQSEYLKNVKSYISSDCRIRCIPPTYKLQHILQQAYCNLSFFTIPHANLALAESIIMKLPTIAAETPESLEYSNNGKLALLYKLGDKEDFYQKVMLLEHDYVHYRDWIGNNASIIENMFDKERNINIVNNILIHQ